MNRLTVAAIVAMLALPASAIAALPASAIAAPASGVVLSVDRGHHTIQVVDAKHRAHGYRYRGSIPRLHPGTRIAFARSGRHAIARVRVTSSRSRTVSFYARVVRSNSRGVVLGLGDGQTIRVSAGQTAARPAALRWRSARLGSGARPASGTRPASSARPARGTRPGTGAHSALHLSTGGVTLNIQGLAPGTVVLISETVAPGGQTTITVTLPAAGPKGTPTGSAQQQPGSPSQPGDGTPEVAGGDAVGTIAQVSADTLTITTDDHRTLSFSLDPADDLTDGFAPGDVVDVTYDQSGGALAASDVEYVEQDASGTVTAVSDGSITVSDGNTGETQTIVADPAEEMFDGVSVNDSVVVTYHQSAGQAIADVVDDETAGN